MDAELTHHVLPCEAGLLTPQLLGHPALLLTWAPSQRGSASLPHEAPRETRTEVGEAHAGCGAGRREAGQHASRPRAPQCPGARHTALVSADRQVQWSQFQGSDRRAFPGLGALLRSDTPLPRSLALARAATLFCRLSALAPPHLPSLARRPFED